MRGVTVNGIVNNSTGTVGAASLSLRTGRWRLLGTQNENSDSLKVQRLLSVP